MRARHAQVSGNTHRRGACHYRETRCLDSEKLKLGSVIGFNKQKGWSPKGPPSCVRGVELGGDGLAFEADRSR
jgi:hypothetical protein